LQGYKIRLEFISPGLPGAGEGWGSVIDTDLVFDSLGLPYFPARRLKGALKESALETLEMMLLANIPAFKKELRDDLIEIAFGKPGSAQGGLINFSNLNLPQYDKVSLWCKWALQEYSNILSPDIIINTFTEIRQQTSINERGVADDHSLRTVRVLKAGIVFEGEVSFYEAGADYEAVTKIIDLLVLSCANLRYLGTMRNRGFGRVRCTLLKNNSNCFDETIDRLAKEAN
jgi:CRISPR/Cas system CSM-associated protein Csm3 (group 7 of RAMP superfamily)